MTKKVPLSSVRAKALIHMQRMLATSAAAMAVSETGCHRGDKTGDAGADAIAFGPPTENDGSAPVVLEPTPVDAGNVITERNHGYAVVDPMPRPVHCPNLQGYLKGSAKKAGTSVVVTITNGGGRDGFKYVMSTPNVYSGHLEKHDIDGKGSAVVHVTPDEGASSITISLHGNCGTDGPVAITAFVTLPTLSVRVSQY